MTEEDLKKYQYKDSVKLILIDGTILICSTNDVDDADENEENISDLSVIIRQISYNPNGRVLYRNMFFYENEIKSIEII